jgi:endonuclease-3
MASLHSVERKQDAPRFAVDLALRAIEEAVAEYPKAALFELADRGYRSVFAQLVSCIISLRTLDEVTLPTALALLKIAPTPAAMLELGVKGLDRAIKASTFHDVKARRLYAIARYAVDHLGGDLPCDERVLSSFSGVGPKTANLVMAIACGEPRIAVDVHVHRVTNRWGLIHTTTPEATLTALTAKAPRPLWTDVNRLLVPFGKHICTGRLPRCSACPVASMCRRVGVGKHR